MSETVLYQIEKSGNVVHYDEINNSHLSAMSIWRQLSEKYSFEMSFMTGPTQAWQAFTKGTYTNAEDIVMGTTFDKVIVEKRNIPHVIEAMKEFDSMHPGTSLLKQVSILESMLEDDDTIGVAWQQTDMGDSLWLPDYIEDDEGNEEPKYYNIHTQTEHWNLFDDLSLHGVDYK